MARGPRWLRGELQGADPGRVVAARTLGVARARVPVAVLARLDRGDPARRIRRPLVRARVRLARRRARGVREWLAIREGHVFGRELGELDSGEPCPPGELERYYDAITEGPGIFKWWHYLPIYERHLARFRGQTVHLVEIGVWSGGSLRMWRDYLGVRSRVTGVDIDPACKAFETDGISVVIGDQGDPAFWQEFLADTAPIDVVIDDGSHLPADQIVTLKALLPELRPGGIYVCEDLHSKGSRFCRFVDGFTRNIDWATTWIPRPDGGRAYETTPFQRSVASVHRYPFVTVIERTQASEARFEAPRRGTEWLPE